MCCYEVWAQLQTRAFKPALSSLKCSLKVQVHRQEKRPCQPISLIVAAVQLNNRLSKYFNWTPSQFEVNWIKFGCGQTLDRLCLASALCWLVWLVKLRTRQRFFSYFFVLVRSSRRRICSLYKFELYCALIVSCVYLFLIWIKSVKTRFVHNEDVL